MALTWSIDPIPSPSINHQPSAQQHNIYSHGGEVDRCEDIKAINFSHYVPLIGFLTTRCLFLCENVYFQ